MTDCRIEIPAWLKYRSELKRTIKQERILLSLEECIKDYIAAKRQIGPKEWAGRNLISGIETPATKRVNRCMNLLQQMTNKTNRAYAQEPEPPESLYHE